MPKNAKIVSPKIEIAVSLKSNPSKSYHWYIFLHPAATDLYVYAKNQPFLNSVKWDKANNVKSVTLLTTDIPTTDETENTLGLDLAYEDTEGNINYIVDFPLIHSSNENVAIVKDDEENDGRPCILARGPGSCKITVTTEDGMKKHTFTVKVVAPVGNIQLSSAAPNGTNAVAYGKSFKLSARAFDTYGKPTSTKLRWEIAKVMNNFGNNVEPSEYGKVLSISQSGVVTVKKGAADLNLRYIRVTASPAGYLPYDGTEIGGSFWIYVTDPIRKIEIGSYPVFALDPDTPTFSGLVKLNDETLQIDTNWKQLISVTSSKPKLVRAWLQQDSYGRYFVYLEARAADFPEKKATVTITVKANDGYGKSASFKVTLQKP
jgi:hypothetical protein